MLYKESAIAVMVAVMLGTASIFGGFSLMPALATHDPNATEITRETIDNEDSMIVDAIELEAEKSFGASGTVTIELLQGDDVLRSATLRASSLGTSLDTIEVDVNNINVTGSFEILVEYMGSGRVTVASLGVVQGTEVAEDTGSGDGDSDEGSSGSENGGSSEPMADGEIVATETITPEDEDGMTVETVEFAAEKSARASGTLTVAIVQDDAVLDSDMIRTGALETSLTDMEASFDVDVTGDFQVVFIYDGSGRVTIVDINVPGTTEPAAEPTDPTDPANPDGSVQLIVEAVDQNNAKIEGLWVALLNGNNGLAAKGYTEINATFTLEPDKTYIVEMGDFFDEETGTAYNFEGWQDSTNDNTRRSANPAEFTDSEETFTALYTVTTGSGPPPADDPADPADPSDPPADPSAPGTVTIFAHRIPSEHWGPTFTGANAEMYFVVYNSTGWIIYSGFFDEDGHVINGLNEGETYWLSPTDCDECHGDPHDVVFDHWEDGSTERQRPVTTGMSAHAYYMYDPDP